jgi:hypothetical protein
MRGENRMREKGKYLNKGTIQGNTGQSPPETQQALHNPIRSWTRLGFGVVLLGLDALINRTNIWETTFDKSHAGVQGANKTDSTDQTSQVRTPSVYFEQNTSVEAEQRRQALVGLVFDLQDRILRGLTTLHRVETLADKAVTPVLAPVTKSRLFRPIRNQFEQLVARGQEQFDQWVQIGKIEEVHSRELVKTATLTTVDTSIDYLSTNPDVKELVQSQSTSLINEIIEEIRERTVSGDTLVEGIVRAVLHLTPRHNLPEPPLEVRMRAVRIRPPKMEKLIQEKW